MQQKNTVTLVNQKALNLKTKSPLIPAQVILIFHLTVWMTFLMNLELTLVQINQKAQLRHLIPAKLHLILHLTVKKVLFKQTGNVLFSSNGVHNCLHTGRFLQQGCHKVSSLSIPVH